MSIERFFVQCVKGRFSRIGILFGVLFVAGCVVEPSQPAPPVKPPAPVVTLPPSLPPPNPLPVPKVYSGSYSDRLEAAAHDIFAGTSVRVQRSANTIKLIIPANVVFAANGSQLQSRFSVLLDGVIRLCREYNKAAITVKGFTDSTGSFEHNQQLSEQRAQNVGERLSREAAVQMRTAGYGPRYPIADNKTDAGRMQNRRIEIDMVSPP